MNFINKNTLSWLLRICISILFLFSACAKLYPSVNYGIANFEVKQLVQQLGFSQCFAPYISRFIIGIEIGLGLGFLINHGFRKLIIPSSILLLLIFNAHLLYTIYHGAASNCGCFGDLLLMTPLQAFFKNLVTIGVIVYIGISVKYKLSNFSDNYYIPVLVTICSILFLFTIAPFCPCSSVQSAGPVVIYNALEKTENVEVQDGDTSSISKQNNESNNSKLDAYEPQKKVSGYVKYAPGIDEGKRLLLFFVPSCEHCLETAKSLNDMAKKNKKFPEMFVIFLNEEPEKIPYFFEFANRKFNYMLMDHGSFFTLMGSRDVPGVLYLWNGNEVAFFDGIDGNEFQVDKLEKAIKSKKIN